MIRESAFTATQKLLLILLAEYAGDNEWAFPSQETLALDMTLKPRQVRNILKQLEPVIETRKGATGVPNHYRINWQRLSEHQQPDRQSSTADRQSSTALTGNGVPTNIHRTSKRTPITNGALRGRSGGSGWQRGGIGTEEFDSLDGAEPRFREAVENGWVGEEDKLRFLTLWAYTGRQYARPADDPNRVRNPGAFLTQCIKAQEWKGSEADEDTARAHLSAQRGETSPESAPLILQLADMLRSKDRHPEYLEDTADAC